MYLLDTSFLIDLVRGKREAIELAKRLDEERAYIAASAVTVYEYLLGVYLSYWGDEEKLKEKLEIAESELARLDVLPFNGEIARKTAEIAAYLLKRGEVIGLADTIIAATALTYNLKLVTRNVKHFSRIPGLKVLTY